MKRTFLIVVFFVVAALCQDGDRTNSLFDDSEIKMFVPANITVEGEVENPGIVELSSLPLHSVPIKELGVEDGKQTFRGAFYVTGYSLHDILNRMKVKKIQGNTFHAPIDMYAIVENDRGTKAVFSWGEIYYTTDGSNIVLSKTVQGINPAKSKTQWPLPPMPRLFCGNDLLNVRFVDNPTRITVRSFKGKFPSAKPKEMYSPDIQILLEGRSTTVGNIGSSVAKRTFTGIGYGHGSGFKGSQSVTGFVLKDLIDREKTSNYLGAGIAVVSARDGYRSVFSVSEVMNRNDNQDVILVDRKDSRADGRYTLYAPDDFFADRDVKAVEKIEILQVP